MNEWRPRLARRSAAAKLSIAAMGALGMTGCDVFDASLIPIEDAATKPSETRDASVDIPPTSLPPGIDVSADCDSAPLLQALPSVPLPLRFADGTCGADPPSGVSCIDGALTGKNFYFSFQSDVDPGDTNPQKWHLNARNSASTSKDFALYVLSSCATTSCSDLNAGVRSAIYEDLAFRVTPGQKYVVVVNTTADNPCVPGRLPKVQLRHDRCNDGIVEHGEACDPPNPNCVACRYLVLGPDSQGVEPNDSPLDANIIPVGPTPFMVMGGAVGEGQAAIDGGTLAGNDPYDFFRLQSQSDADVPKIVRVTLSWHEPLSEGGACADVYLAAIYITDKWYDPSTVGHSGIQPVPPVAMPDPDGSNLFECTTFIDIPFDSDVQSGMPSLSRFFIRVAAAPSKLVSYDMIIEQPSDQ